VIIIKYNDIYLPLIHIFGESPDNLIYKCIINKLKINNLENVEETLEPTLDLTEQVSAEQVSAEQVSAPEPNKKKLGLKALSSYKLIELQDMSKQNGISIINNNGKARPKTKKQLYEDLLTVN
jgi:hypothetical protein